MILGPARNLRRVREQAAEVEDVQGLFGFQGAGAYDLDHVPPDGDAAGGFRVTLNRPALGGAGSTAWLRPASSSSIGRCRRRSRHRSPVAVGRGGNRGATTAV